MASAAPKLLVCADDLTGANDIGVQFARRGIRALVRIEPDFHQLPGGCEVLVVNTESRHLSPAAAAERVRRAVELGRSQGVRWFYKKTDSTLRGNVGAELEALARAAGAKVLPFVPAFPQLGRTTRAGIHYVHGQPLHESPFGRDPLNPARSSSVAEILAEQCTLPLHAATRSLPAGPSEGILIFDAETAADLKTIARELADQGLLGICAGPAAFGEHLAALLPFERSTPEPIAPSEPMLLVNGSMNERSLAQITAAKGDALVLKLEPELVLGPCESPPRKMDDLISRALSAQGNVILFTIHSTAEAAAYLQEGKRQGLDGHQTHLRVAEATGRIVQALLPAFRSLTVFGGDTLMGIARACGWGGLIPVTEVADGITASRPLNSPLLVISKAGGFGDCDVAQRLFDFAARPGG